MGKDNIYIIKNLFIKMKEWNVDNISFKDKEKAIDYCNSKLTEEERKDNQNKKKRNLLNWYEFHSKDYIYEIKVIDLI